jgi:hypothetical protein
METLQTTIAAGQAPSVAGRSAKALIAAHFAKLTGSVVGMKVIGVALPKNSAKEATVKLENGQLYRVRPASLEKVIGDDDTILEGTWVTSDNTLAPQGNSVTAEY